MWVILVILLIIVVILLTWTSKTMEYVGAGDWPVPPVTWKVPARAQYALTMTDPDAPNREAPTQADWLHWLIVDIPVHDQTLRVDQGKTLMPFAGPSPPPGSGPHRYYTRVWQQATPYTQSFTMPRAKFPTQKFAQQQGWTMIHENVQVHEK